MASTITAATMTVKIIETISLNGKDQGSTNTQTIASINEISKRILTITTAESVIATFSSAVASAGHFVAANVRYMRFTNKDDTNFITLTFRNQDNDEVAIKLDAGQSFVWNADNSGGLVDNMDANSGGAASSGQLGDITKVQIRQTQPHVMWRCL